MTVTQGTWSIFGHKLPDLGLTEKYAPSLGVNPNRSLTIPVNVNNGQIQGTPLVPYQPAPAPQPKKDPQNLNVNTPSSVPQTQTYINQVNDTANNYSSLLEQDYNNAMGQLSGQEQGLRSQADTATQQITNDYGQTLNQLGQEQGTAQQGIQSQISTGETNAKTGMQQARDIFRQTQQSNIAQLSALGISSSSVSEALAERLGVETARRIAGITGSLSEIRQNATQELSRINNYYEQKRTGLEQTVSIEKSKIQQALISGLNQINYARDQAATDKARARLDLLTNAQNQINQINQQAQQFDLSLKQWATTKANAINQFVSDPAQVAKYQQSIANLNASPGITQQYLGNYGVNNTGDFGYYTGPLKSNKKEDPNTIKDVNGNSVQDANGNTLTW